MTNPIKWFLLLSFCVMIIASFKRDALPSPKLIQTPLAQEPVQIPINIPPFVITKERVTYTITPLYKYELSGLVVSEHNTDSLFDYYHKKWGDVLNVKDVCVVWGSNATSGIYNQFSFKNGSWTCYYKTNDRGALNLFSADKLSNNHLLATSNSITKKLRSIRPGDQVRIVGYLAEYTHDGGFRRGTSITRTDRGNGACETIFVTEVEILSRANLIWRNVFLLSLWSFLGLIILRIIFFLAKLDRFSAK